MKKNKKNSPQKTAAKIEVKPKSKSKAMKKSAKSAVEKLKVSVKSANSAKSVKSAKSAKSVASAKSGTSAKAVKEPKVKSRRHSKGERRRGVLSPVYDRLLNRGIVIERRRQGDRRVK